MDRDGEVDGWIVDYAFSGAVDRHVTRGGRSGFAMVATAAGGAAPTGTAVKSGPTDAGTREFDVLLAAALRQARTDPAAAAAPPLPRPVVEMIRRAFASHRSVRRLHRQVEDVLATLAVAPPGTVR